MLKTMLIHFLLIKSSTVKHLFGIEIFCNNVKVITVTVDEFNVFSSMNISLSFFKSYLQSYL